jgi:hypothetical protein
MKMITGSVRFAWRAVVLPVKVLIASIGLTFRAGFGLGRLPVRGGAAVTRAFGWKIVIAVVVGAVVGFIVGRKVTLYMNDHDHDHGHGHGHGDGDGHDHDHDHDHGHDHDDDDDQESVA